MIVRGSTTVLALAARRTARPWPSPARTRARVRTPRRVRRSRSSRAAPGASPAVAIAERPQRRELPRPLGDRHRDGVEDHERADEQRDRGECEQEVADELGAARDGLVVGVRLLSGRAQLRRGREQRFDTGPAELATSWLGDDRDAVEAARLSSSCCISLTSKAAIVALPVDTPANSMRPVIVYRCTGPLALAPMLSPTL